MTLPQGYDVPTFWRRLMLLFVIPHLAFGLLAGATTAQVLIPLLNGAALALSVGVCVAFLPAIAAIFFKAKALDRADYLAFGIWLTWFAVVLQAAWSLIWRARGMPLWMVSTDFTSYFLFMRVCGAVFHLAAPAAIDDHIPPRRWIMIGILIAIAVAVVMALSYVLDVATLEIPRIPA